jgi:2,3-dihydroxyphenylpropionate 1,2-dioxygenase
MNAMLVCASHSPLMLVDMPPSGPDSQAFLKREAEVRARVARFDPQLVVVFGPDHFNGFFFDLMPPFCIGAAAETTQDWSLPRLSLNVPAETALACVHALRSEDIDVALSWKMRADHGISIALRQFTAAAACCRSSSTAPRRRGLRSGARASSAARSGVSCARSASGC